MPRDMSVTTSAAGPQWAANHVNFTKEPGAGIIKGCYCLASSDCVGGTDGIIKAEQASTELTVLSPHSPIRRTAADLPGVVAPTTDSPKETALAPQQSQVYSRFSRNGGQMP